MKSHSLRSPSGYSLVEIITVIALMGALALAGVVAYRGYYQWGKTQADAHDLSTINSALEVLKYHNNNHVSLSGANTEAHHTAVLTAIRGLSENPIPGDVVIDASKLSSTGSGSNFRFTAYDSAGTSYASSGEPSTPIAQAATSYTETDVVLNGHQITGLTGGAGNLDGVLTDGRTSGIRMVVANGGKLDTYTLVSGSSATNVPSIIRPLDYSDTNQRVWVRSGWYGALDSTLNLSDVSDPTVALDNLGAGSMAVQDAGAVAITGGTANFNTDGFTVSNQIGSSGGSLWLNGGMLGSYTSRATISSGGSSVGSGLTLLGPAGGQDYSILSTGAGASAGTGKLGFFDATVGAFRGVVDNQGDWGFGTEDPLARVTVRGRAGQAPLRIENTAGESIFTVNADGSISGGTFDGGDIGGTTPGKGTFTDLTVTGTVTFSALPDGFLKTDSDGKISVVSGASLVSSLDLGTMASQDADAVAISGGTINGTTIGQTVSEKGKFTDLEGVNLKATGTVQFTTLTDGFLKTDASGNTTAVSGASLLSGLGLGTLSTQNADAVAITGGTINGTTIGQSVAEKGKFSDLHSTGSLRHEGIGAGFMKTDSDGNVSTTSAPPDIPIGGTILYPSSAQSIDGGKFLLLDGQLYDPATYPDLNTVLVAAGLTNPSSLSVDLGLGGASRFMGFDGSDRPIWFGAGGIATWSDSTGKTLLNANNAQNGPPLMAYQAAGDGTVQPVIMGHVSLSSPYPIVFVDGTTRSLSGSSSFTNSVPTWVVSGYVYSQTASYNNYVNLSTGSVVGMTAPPGGWNSKVVLADRILGINPSREVYLFDPIANSWSLQATLPVGFGVPHVSRDGTLWGYRTSTNSYQYTNGNGASLTTVAASGITSPAYWRLGNGGKIFEMAGSTNAAAYYPRVWDGTIWRTITFSNPNGVQTNEDWIDDSIMGRVPANIAGYIRIGGTHIACVLWSGTVWSSNTPAYVSRSPTGTIWGYAYSTSSTFLTSSDGVNFSTSGTFQATLSGPMGGFIGVATDSSYVIVGHTTSTTISQGSTGPTKMFTKTLGTVRYLPSIATTPTVTGLPAFKYYIKARN